MIWLMLSQCFLKRFVGLLVKHNVRVLFCNINHFKMTDVLTGIVKICKLATHCIIWEQRTDQRNTGTITNWPSNNNIPELPQSELEENKVTIGQIEEEKSEMISQLMMKENELTKLKEDNKLLVKQFRERKDRKRKETIPQVCSS